MLINDRTSRVVKMFCSTNSERFELVEPYIQSGYIYATDTFTLIRVPTDLPDDESSIRLPLSENKSMGKHFPLQIIQGICEKPIISNYEVSCDKLDQLIGLFKKVPVLDYSIQVECPKCHGDGEIECEHCRSDYECPNCNGDGTIGKPRETGELMFDENIYVIINDTTCVQGSYLIRIREVAKELNQDMVKFGFINTQDYIDPIKGTVCYNTQPLMVTVGDALMCIMPLKEAKDSHSSNVQIVTL